MSADEKPDYFEDVCYGTEEQMLAWCEREGLTPAKDKDGRWDWDVPWAEYCKRLGEEPEREA